MVDNHADVEMLSPKVSTRSDQTKTSQRMIYSDADDEVFNEEMVGFAEKAERDNKILKGILSPQLDNESFSESGVKWEFLKDPTAWMNTYNSHVTEFAEDDHYLGYVVGLLEVIVNSSPYGADRYDIYSPLLLLRKIVTVTALKARRDPMRTALKLQYRLQEYAQIENDQNSIYDRQIEELENIASYFTITLMKACITPLEVRNLMRLDDDTMFVDVLKSKNKRLVASKMYQKVVWRKFWGSEVTSDKKAKDGRLIKMLRACKRLADFFFWNFFYVPLDLIDRYTGREERRQKRKGMFFTPFSSYLADVLNYSILIIFLLIVIMTTVPDPRPVHILIHGLEAGNMTAENNTNFRILEDGSVQIKIPTPDIPPSEWVLWGCIFARVLAEWYQASQKKGSTAKAKLKKYFKCASNLADIALLLLLLTGMVCKLQMFITSCVVGVYHGIEEDKFGMVSQRLILTIYLYSTGVVLALVNFLDNATIHVPGLGPLIRAIKRMFADIIPVLFLFGFFIFGFIVPMLGLVSCYRAVHGIDGVDDADDFYSFRTFGNSLLTLVWSMFGGLAYNHKENLYKSQDDMTTVFMSFLLVLYAILLGLMCMNLLIAMMCSTYSQVTADKSADWRYAQFESIMEYNAVTNEGNGMPYLFPLCIPYIIYSLITTAYRKRRQRRRATDTDKDNHIAKFLCKYRLNKKHAVKEETLQKKMVTSSSSSSDDTQRTKSINHKTKVLLALNKLKVNTRR